MRTVLKDKTVLEGTPEEITDVLGLKQNTNPIMIDGEVFEAELPRQLKTRKKKETKGTYFDRIKPLFSHHPRMVSKDSILLSLGMTDENWRHGSGWSLKTRIKKYLPEYEWDYISQSYILNKKTKEYMQKRKDWTTRGAKTSRYFNVSPSRARQIEQTNRVPIREKTRQEWLDLFTKQLKIAGLTVGRDFFSALANVIKEKDESRLRTFIASNMNEEQYTNIFVPWMLKNYEQFFEEYGIKGKLIITSTGMRIK